jgi:hypothetical protein
MKSNITYIVIGVVIALALLLWLFSRSATSPLTDKASPYTGSRSTQVSVGTSTNQHPGSTNSGSPFAPIAISTLKGNPIAVNDFTKDPQTATSTNIPGHYFIAGGVDAFSNGSPYSIYYYDKDNSFTITILDEPIGELRMQAEQLLQQKLGITQAAMCNLRYYLSVRNDLNPLYAGKNLGFSFCPGATRL